MDGTTFDAMMAQVMTEADPAAVMRGMTSGMVPGRYRRFFVDFAPLPPLNDPRIVTADVEDVGCAAVIGGIDMSDLREEWEAAGPVVDVSVHERVVERVADAVTHATPQPVIAIDCGSTVENYGAPYRVPECNIWTELFPTETGGVLVGGAVPAVRVPIGGVDGFIGFISGNYGVWDPDPGVAAAGVRGVWGGDWGLSHPPGSLCEVLSYGTVVQVVDWGDVHREALPAHEGDWNDPPGYDRLVVQTWERKGD